MKTSEEWEQARRHVEGCKDAYVALLGVPGVAVGFALTLTIEPLLRRFNGGERTDALYAEMMGVQ